MLAMFHVEHGRERHVPGTWCSAADVRERRVPGRAQAVSARLIDGGV